MTDSFTTRFLIPAAGFGKRLGCPSAKELLVLNNEERPMIEWCLDLAVKYRCKPLVISRRNKKTLNDYLLEKKQDYGIDIFYIDESKEWADSILQSEAEWFDKNIVVLPDTRFSPQDTIADLKNILDYEPYALSTFKVEDASSWGMLRHINNAACIAEKPNDLQAGDLAWGLLSFQKKFGRSLLKKILESNGDHQFKCFHTGIVATSPLEAFEDKTREGLSVFKP